MGGFERLYVSVFVESEINSNDEESLLTALDNLQGDV